MNDFNPVAHVWHNAATQPNDYLLVRVYRSGETTGERYVDGVAQGEFALTSEPLSTAVPA